MSRIVLVGLIVLALSACKPMEPTSRRIGPSGESGIVTSEPERGVNIVDVEYAVHIHGGLAKQSEAPNITVDKLVNARNYVDLATITVNPPYPEGLWVTFQTSSVEDFFDTPVALRAKVYVDKKAVDSFTVTLGERLIGKTEGYSMDVLSKIEGVPETVLVYAQAEALLMPEGTDPASVDPETATAPPARTGTVISNPIRINFTRSEEAP